MKVAVLCEFSGIVRDAFIEAGHDAISCDLEPTEKPGPHIQGDCRDYDWSGYDLIIAHPPCTYLATSGNRWFRDNPKRYEKQIKAINFVIWIMRLSVKHIAIENSVSAISSYIRPADQIIQPWQFGEPHSKATCLWLKNLPHLIPTKIVKPKYKQYDGYRMPLCHEVKSKGEKRRKERSKFFPGIAKAMAEQWGCL